MSRLLSASDFGRLIESADLARFVQALQASDYGSEIAAVKQDAPSIPRIDEAVRRHLGRTWDALGRAARGRAGEMVEALFFEWDLASLLGVIRGIHHGRPAAEVLDGAVPTPRFSEAVLAHLAGLADLDAISAVLSLWKDPFSLPFRRGLEGYARTGGSHRDGGGPDARKSRLRHVASRFDRGDGKGLAAYLSMVADGLGLVSAFRSRGTEAEVAPISGGRLRAADLLFVRNAPTLQEAIDGLKNRLGLPGFVARGLRPDHPRPAAEVERLAALWRARFVDAAARRDPLSAFLTASFVHSKIHEAARIRALARSKEHGMPKGVQIEALAWGSPDASPRLSLPSRRVSRVPARGVSMRRRGGRSRRPTGRGIFDARSSRGAHRDRRGDLPIAPGTSPEEGGRIEPSRRCADPLSIRLGAGLGPRGLHYPDDPAGGRVPASNQAVNPQLRRIPLPL